MNQNITRLTAMIIGNGIKINNFANVIVFVNTHMNILQVGRPAVSRYHRNRKFSLVNDGVDHEVHDFPTAELGIKLGGGSWPLVDQVSKVDDLGRSLCDCFAILNIKL
jgi:hypothetical protein